MGRKKIKIGVVGCGNIFKKHLQGILDNGDHFEIVGIANHSKEGGLQLPREWNVKTFYDQTEMFAELGTEMDLVIILVQSIYHYDIAKEALEAGYDVLIEKPIDSVVSRLEELDILASKLGRNAYAVLQCRYLPVVDSLKRILEGRLIGDIRCVDFAQVWQRPLGYLTEKQARLLFEYGVHYIDLLQILFGVPKVFFTKTFKHKLIKAPYEDTLRTIVEYDGGISGSITVTLAAEPQNLETKLSIIGSKGSLEVDFRENEIKGLFEDEKDEKEYNELIKNILEINSFKQLYENISLGRGITVKDSIPVIQFIQDIYAKEGK